MLISDKQHAANRQNAQQSSGPVTPEGKAAVRLNALTYGLRARSIIIAGEDPEQYKQLWADLAAEWQPQTCTERIFLEQMATSQWLLARIATGESAIYEAQIALAEQFVLLAQVAKQRTSLERSLSSAMRELKQLQKERRATRAERRSPQSVRSKPAAQAQSPVRPPGYPASEGSEAPPAFGAPATPDTR
jgi:hypothetical protein